VEEKWGDAWGELDREIDYEDMLYQ